jgi:hypothetical protein
MATDANTLAQQWQKIDEALGIAGARAIDARGGSVGQSKVFAFARILRGWSWTGKDGKPMEPTAEQVADYIESVYVRHHKPIYQKWNPAQVDGLSFWDAGYIEDGDPRGEFLVAWDDIKIVEGKTLLETAEKNSSDLPLKPCKAHSQKYCQFVSFAGHLQRLRRAEQNIQLPVELLAKRFEVSPRMISQYRRWAVRDGILREMRAANSFQKQATDYRFEVDKFNWKSGRQTPIESPIELTVEPTVEPQPSSIGSSTIGFSGSSEVSERSYIEPNGELLKHEILKSTSTPKAKPKKLPRMEEPKCPSCHGRMTRIVQSFSGQAFCSEACKTTGPRKATATAEVAQ